MTKDTMRILILLCLCIGAFGASSDHAKKNRQAIAEPDITAPTAPTNFTAVAVDANTVVCTWTASTDDSGTVFYWVIHPDLQMGISGTITETTWTSHAFIAGETYTFGVFAFDAAGNYSDDSSYVTVTMPLTPAWEGAAP
jgi:hypothetical protein